MSRIAAALVALLLASAAPAQEDLPAAVRVGDRLPPLSGVDLAGNPVTLKEITGPGAVVLSFWSVHCRDCVRELDDLRAIRREFPAEDLTVVAVNTDSGLPLERIAGFVRRYEAARGELGVAHLVDRDAAILQGLGIRFIPLLVVTDPSGRVTAVVSGYREGDRERLSRALEEGTVALGAWGEGLRGRLVTLLRSRGPAGEVEWGSFRVEAELPRFGLHDATGWIADAAGRRDREAETRRVEAVVADRLKVALARDALASVGVRLPSPEDPGRPGEGLRVPESPLAGDGRWARLYAALGFDGLYREEARQGVWTGDVYRAGLVGDVDLGRLRARLRELGFPEAPRSIRLEVVSDFDFKARAVLEELRRTSYRLQQVRGEDLVYYGTADQLAAEIQALALGLRLFAEPLAEDRVRVEVF
ncbi:MULTISPECIES: peroxiredoxin family protein [Deferrisoma]